MLRMFTVAEFNREIDSSEDALRATTFGFSSKDEEYIIEFLNILWDVDGDNPKIVQFDLDTPDFFSFSEPFDFAKHIQDFQKIDFANIFAEPEENAPKFMGLKKIVFVDSGSKKRESFPESNENVRIEHKVFESGIWSIYYELNDDVIKRFNEDLRKEQE